MSIVTTVFNTMMGSWRFSRSISNGFTVEGVATFIKQPTENNTLSYREDGMMTSAEGQVLKVYQEYIYRCEENQIVVYFTDKRHFHTLEFSSDTYPLLASGGNHLCKCDTYKPTYTFFHDAKFTLQYNVKGPEKDYSIVTNFTKIKD